MKTIMVVLGTRPEAVKLAPVVAALRNCSNVRTIVVATGQHAHMVAPVARVLGMEIDHDLGIMSHGQSLNQIVTRAIAGVDALIQETAPDTVVVQGDTSTAMAAALAAFNRKVAIAHVEAGLRTGDRTSPWPEEANRVLIGRLADIHFTPTQLASSNLINEGVAERDIHMVGNTVVDAARMAAAYADALPYADHDEERQTILVTSHRRESIGKPMEDAFTGIATVAAARAVRIIFPVHPNPLVREIASRVMGGIANIEMIEPLDYDELVVALRRCRFVVTDSGGIVEEAAAFGKPALVLRESTERTESIDSVGAELVGTDAALIEARMLALIDDDALHMRMAQAPNPFGDGQSSRRIADVLSGRNRRPIQNPGSETAPQMAEA